MTSALGRQSLRQRSMPRYAQKDGGPKKKGEEDDGE